MEELYVLSMKTDKIYLKGQYGSTHILPDKTLAKVFVLSMKIDKIYLKGLYRSTHIVSNKTLAKVSEVNDGNLHIVLVRIIRVKPYCHVITVCWTCWKI